MARVDAIARILAQALSSYLLSCGAELTEGDNNVFIGANCLCTTVEMPSRPEHRPRRS